MKLWDAIKKEWIIALVGILVVASETRNITYSILAGNSFFDLETIFPLGSILGMISMFFVFINYNWKLTLGSMIAIFASIVLSGMRLTVQFSPFRAISFFAYIYILGIGFLKLYMSKYRPVVLLAHFFLPRNSKVIYQRALSDYKADNYESALRYGRQLFTTDCPFHLAAYIVGNASAYTGDYKTAAELLSKLTINDVGKECWLYSQYGLALSYQNLEEFQKAADLFETYKAEYPKDYNTNFNLALCYSELENEERAIMAYTEILEMYPNDCNVLYNRGCAFDRIDQRKKAFDDWKKALEVSPICEKAYVTVGLHYWEDDDIDTALEYYKKAYDCQPSFVEYFPDEIKERLSIEKA